MKRFLPITILGLLAAALAGCASDTAMKPPSAPAQSPASVAQQVQSDPNMPESEKKQILAHSGALAQPAKRESKRADLAH